MAALLIEDGYFLVREGDASGYITLKAGKSSLIHDASAYFSFHFLNSKVVGELLSLKTEILL